MDGHTLARADNAASSIAQALGVEGGHLFIGHNGNILHYACGARLHGYDNDVMKAACAASGLPVIDARQVAFTDLWRIVVSEPEVAVGTPEELRPWHWVPHAPLIAVAGLYRAAGPRCSTCRPSQRRSRQRHDVGLGNRLHWRIARRRRPAPADRPRGWDRGRTVCIVPGHLEWRTAEGDFVRLLDERDIANARVIAAAMRVQAVLHRLTGWAASMGGWDAPCWNEAQAMLASLQVPDLPAEGGS